MLFDGRLRGRARDFNWHNVIGIWCARVLLVVILTGLVIYHRWVELAQLNHGAHLRRPLPTLCPWCALRLAGQPQLDLVEAVADRAVDADGGHRGIGGRPAADRRGVNAKQIS
jgi:uncharacterized iron-regulated membrane protein